MIKQFYLPVDIPPGESSSAAVSYKTGAYEAAIASKKDWLSLHCNRLTKEMMFEVNLEGNLKNTHKLSKINERDDYHQIIEFLVFDASKERMITTELELKEQKNQPKYLDTYISWKIPNPKVGYFYRLYFTILPKNNNVHSTVSSCNACSERPE
jgi:hypothetical protein